MPFFLLNFQKYSFLDLLLTYKRFNVRGSDASGNVANFVETEQILIYLDFKLSFVQACFYYDCFFFNLLSKYS